MNRRLCLSSPLARLMQRREQNDPCGQKQSNPQRKTAALWSIIWWKHG
jgi:hypothetical protein